MDEFALLKNVFGVEEKGEEPAAYPRMTHEEYQPAWDEEPAVRAADSRPIMKVIVDLAEFPRTNGDCDYAAVVQQPMRIEMPLIRALIQVWQTGHAIELAYAPCGIVLEICRKERGYGQPLNGWRECVPIAHHHDDGQISLLLADAIHRGLLGLRTISPE